MRRRRHRAGLGLLAGCLTVGALALPASAGTGAVPSTAWTAYLHGARHSSDAATAGAVTRAATATLHVAWTWTPPGTGGPLNASPVSDGTTVYVNSGTGTFYALVQATGKVRWSKPIPPAPCRGKGSISTASVLTDPVDGRLTVYVLGADNFLYALDPATGATRWRSVVGGTSRSFYASSSPTVAGGVVYLAVTSACGDTSHGGAAAYDQHTGAPLGAYETSAATSGLPNVYTSALADGPDVYVTTGDGASGDNDAVVRLRARDLVRQEAWEIPSPPDNSDFNASPAFFTRAVGASRVDMVGVCNKDGNYYALRAGALAAGPVWTARVGLDSQALPGELRFCGGSSAWDSSRKILLIGANQRALGDSDLGSAYSLNPQNGAVRWRTGLPAGPVIGSVSVNSAGIAAFPTYDAGGGIGKVYLLDEGTGQLLRTLPADGPVFAQPVFNGRQLLVAAGGSLTAWVP